MFHATATLDRPAPPRASYPNVPRLVQRADRRVRELADTMVRLNADSLEGCTETTLLLEGFSVDEQREFGPAARRLANGTFLRQDAPGADEPPPDELLIAESVKMFEQLPVAFVARLRARLDDDTLARLWPKIATGAASRLARSPLPGRM